MITFDGPVYPEQLIEELVKAGVQYRKGLLDVREDWQGVRVQPANKAEADIVRAVLATHAPSRLRILAPAGARGPQLLDELSTIPGAQAGDFAVWGDRLVTYPATLEGEVRAVLNSHVPQPPEPPPDLAALFTTLREATNFNQLKAAIIAYEEGKHPELRPRRKAVPRQKIK